MPHVYVHAWTLRCFYSLRTQTFQKELTASVKSCAELKSAPSVALLVLAESGRWCRKAMFGVCTHGRFFASFQRRLL